MINKNSMKEKSLSSIFKLYLFILESCVDVVKELHHSHFANDIKSYQTIILNRIVKTLNTLNQILEVSKDPISGYCLLRTIADSICSYCFIYENDNGDEVEFRHFLFLLDGCSQFVNTFPSSLSNNELIDEKDKYKNRIVIEQERTDLNDFQQNTFAFLHNTHMVLTLPNDTERIIQNCDWKYREIITYSKKDSYNWQDIYEKAGCDVTMVNFLSSLLSQYVHGLFFSNTNNPNSEVHYTLIFDVAITLERRLISAIKNCFKEDNVDILMFKKMDLDKFADIDIDRDSALSYFKTTK